MCCPLVGRVTARGVSARLLRLPRPRPAGQPLRGKRRSRSSSAGPVRALPGVDSISSLLRSGLYVRARRHPQTERLFPRPTAWIALRDHVARVLRAALPPPLSAAWMLSWCPPMRRCMSLLGSLRFHDPHSLPPTSRDCAPRSLPFSVILHETRNSIQEIRAVMVSQDDQEHIALWLSVAGRCVRALPLQLPRPSPPPPSDVRGRLSGTRNCIFARPLTLTRPDATCHPSDTPPARSCPAPPPATEGEYSTGGASARVPRPMRKHMVGCRARGSWTRN